MKNEQIKEITSKAIQQLIAAKQGKPKTKLKGGLEV